MEAAGAGSFDHCHQAVQRELCDVLTVTSLKTTIHLHNPCTPALRRYYMSLLHKDNTLAALCLKQPQSLSFLSESCICVLILSLSI